MTSSIPSELWNLFERLVAFNSIPERPTRDIAAFIAERLEASGMSLEIVTQLDASGMKKDSVIP